MWLGVWGGVVRMGGCGLFCGTVIVARGVGVVVGVGVGLGPGRSGAGGFHRGVPAVRADVLDAQRNPHGQGGHAGDGGGDPADGPNLAAPLVGLLGEAAAGVDLAGLAVQ